jgi:hypothetical protein
MRWTPRGTEVKYGAVIGCENPITWSFRLGTYTYKNASFLVNRSAVFYLHILDFKQVFQFDSPQIFKFLKIFRKMHTRQGIRPFKK